MFEFRILDNQIIIYKNGLFFRKVLGNDLSDALKKAKQIMDNKSPSIEGR